MFPRSNTVKFAPARFGRFPASSSYGSGYNNNLEFEQVSELYIRNAEKAKQVLLYKNRLNWQMMFVSIFSSPFQGIAAVICFILPFIVAFGGILGPSYQLSYGPAVTQEIVIGVPNLAASASVTTGSTVAAAAAVPVPSPIPAEVKTVIVDPGRENPAQENDIKCQRFMPNSCSSRWAVLRDIELPDGLIESTRVRGSSCNAECEESPNLTLFFGYCYCRTTPAGL